MSRFSALRRHRHLFTISVAAIALTSTIIAFVPTAGAKLFDGPVDRLPAIERDALRQGKVILNGEKGIYTARILVTGSVATAWEVLTDYEHFEQFLPNISEGELIEADGNRKVFEQVNQVRTFIFTQKARVRLSITENYPQQITFNALEGDLKSLDGFWQLEPVSPYPSAPPNQVLITHRVSVEPNSSFGGVFYDIYEDALEDTLAAIKQEVEQRSFQAFELKSAWQKAVE